MPSGKKMKNNNQNLINKVFVICPTFRSPGKRNVARLLGPVALLDQMEKQDFKGSIHVAIIDSSTTAHPFFCKLSSGQNDKFIYLHVPNRNAVAPEMKAEFPNAMGFIPNDQEISHPEWQKQVLQSIAWDSFLPWDEKYPITETLAQQISNSRPTIGMKRNAGIAALEERFGAADLIVYADDDDYRSTSYVRELADGIGMHDFTRMLKYITCSIRNDEIKWGVCDIDFEPDANGNWLPPSGIGKKVLKNSLGPGEYYSSTIEDKYSRLKCLAFPPISYEGALHAYKFDLWKKAVNGFGGVPITSMCEDVFFYKKCRDAFGEKFLVTKTTVTDPSFVRMSDGANASVIEWTEDLSEKDVPEWVIKAIGPLLNASEILPFNAEDYFRKIARQYEETGQIS